MVEISPSAILAHFPITQNTRVTVVVLVLDDKRPIPLDQTRIPPGDVLVHIGELAKDQPLQFRQRLNEMRALPYKFKLVVGGNHDREGNGDSIEYLRARRARRESYGMARHEGVVYLQDESVEVEFVVKGRRLRLLRTPKSLSVTRASILTGLWDFSHPGGYIIITDGSPQPKQKSTISDSLRKNLWRFQPLLRIFRHGYDDTTLYFGGEQEYEAVSTQQI